MNDNHTHVLLNQLHGLHAERDKLHAKAQRKMAKVIALLELRDNVDLDIKEVQAELFSHPLYEVR